MITFVLTSRNDNYGGCVHGVEHANMRRLQLACASIHNLDPVHCHIIVVEWDPVPDQKRIRDFVPSYVQVIAVSHALQELLNRDKKDLPLPFYEYLGKEIGARCARDPFVLFTNADNLFPLKNFSNVVHHLTKGAVVRGVRHDLPRDILQQNDRLILEGASAFSFRGKSVFDTAAGDCLGVTKDLYFQLGGFRFVHGNWDLDNDFVRRASQVARVEFCYDHYHIDHDFAATEMPSRPRGCLAAAHQPIAPEIVAQLMAYISEV